MTDHEPIPEEVRDDRERDRADRRLELGWGVNDRPAAVPDRRAGRAERVSALPGPRRHGSPGPRGSAPNGANRRVLGQARKRGRPEEQTRALIALHQEETHGEPARDLHDAEEVLVA